MDFEFLLILCAESIKLLAGLELAKSLLHTFALFGQAFVQEKETILLPYIQSEANHRLDEIASGYHNGFPLSQPTMIRSP